MKISKSRVFLFVSIIFFLILLITQGDPFVRSDGYYYFHTGKTLVDEGNFVTSTKPEYWDVAASWTQTFFNNQYISVTSSGTGILIAPSLFISKILNNNFDYYNNYFIEYNGHTFFDGLLLLINAIVFFALSIVIIYKTQKLLNFSKRVAYISISAIIISSYMLWYVVMNSTFTHIYEIFFISALIYLLLSFEKTKIKKYLILLGIVMGFLFLIRPVFALVIIPTLVYLINFKDLKQSLRDILVIGIAAFPFLIIYLIYNYVSYGSLLVSGYEITRGETFGFSTFKGLNILFSPTKGWFTYSPIMIFSIIGYVIKFKTNKKFVSYALFSIFSLVFVYGFWPNWWGGGGYGSRFLLYTVPFCIIGLCYFLLGAKNIRYKNVLYVMLCFCVIYSSLILLLYRVTPLKSDFNLPTVFFTNQIALANQSSGIKDFVSRNLENIQTGSGFMAIATGRLDYILKPEVDGNKVNFNLVAPPHSLQRISEQIQGYLLDKQTNTVYSIIFNDFSSNNYYVECTKLCVSNADIKIIEISSLEVEKYSGVNINDRFSFYLQSGKNIQLRGSLIIWDLNTRIYNLI